MAYARRVFFRRGVRRIDTSVTRDRHANTSDTESALYGCCADPCESGRVHTVSMSTLGALCVFMSDLEAFLDWYFGIVPSKW